MPAIPSPFTLFFLENYYSRNDHELHQIQDIIQAYESEVARLDVQIGELAPSGPGIDKLNAERAQHQEALEQHRSLLAPIRKVPDDVLGEIFLHLRVEADSPRLPRSVETPESSAAEQASFELAIDTPPFSFLRVSRQWRRVARSYSHLWNHIIVQLPKRPPLGVDRPTWMFYKAQIESYVVAFRISIELSRTLPLSIYIDDLPTKPHPRKSAGFGRDSIGDILLNLLSPLLYDEGPNSSSSRLKSLTARLYYNSSIFYNLFNADIETFPVLESVSLNVKMPAEKRVPWYSGRWWIRKRYRCAAALFHSPAMKVLDMSTMPRFQDLQYMLTLWAPKQIQSGIGLTVLRNVSATPLEVYHILATCVNLEVAGFVCPKLIHDPRGFDTDEEFEKLADIDSTSLKEVMFKNFRPDFLNSVTEKVNFPVLEKLELVNRLCRHTSWYDCTEQPFDIISDCASTLTSLTLDHACITRAYLAGYFSRLGQLRALRLDYSEKSDINFRYERGGAFDNAVLKALTQRQVLPALPPRLPLPNLTEFESNTLSLDPATKPSPWVFDREVVQAFVNARRRPKVAELNNVAELTRFRIQCDLKETREPVAVTGAVDSLSKKESKEAKEAEEKAKQTEGPENIAVQGDGEEGEEGTEGAKQEDEKASEEKECESAHVEVQSDSNVSSNDPESQPSNQEDATPAIDTQKHDIDLKPTLIQDGVNVDGLSAIATFQLVSLSLSPSSSSSSSSSQLGNSEDEEEDDEDERDNPESWEHSAYLGGSYAAWHDFSDGSEWHPDAWKDWDRYYYRVRPFC